MQLDDVYGSVGELGRYQVGRAEYYELCDNDVKIDRLNIVLRPCMGLVHKRNRNRYVL